MATIMEGQPFPDVTITQTKTQTAPEYYTDYLSGLAGVGEDYLSKTGKELIAGYDPLQTAGYDKVTAGAGAYASPLSSAQKNIGEVAGGIDVDRISEFMNPYQKNVVEEMERQAQQQLQRSILPTLKAGFVGSGGLGGQRYAGALGQALADVQADLTGKTYGALSSGYKDALNAALQEAQTRTQASNVQGNLAEMAQRLGLGESEALRKAGAEKQAYEQALLNAPLTTATNVSGLMRGYTIPTEQTDVYFGPQQASYYQKSPLDMYGDILASGAGLLGYSPQQIGQTFKSGLSDVFDWAKNYDWRGLTNPTGFDYWGGSD